MGDITKPNAVLLLVAASSRYSAALDWAGERIGERCGQVGLVSEAFDFTETAYYAATMGDELRNNSSLAPNRSTRANSRTKRETNDWEAEYAALGSHPEPRPLNLDPGYITPAKLVLASTKDHAHRLYLRDGIYAEVTLAYRSRQWQPLDWTYPDYRRGDFQAFFTACREHLLAIRGG